MTETPRVTPLPSSSDADPYVPLSWMAVAAVLSVVVFVVLLLVLAIDAFWKKVPLLEPELVLICVAVVIILSFVGRRRIRNSEGTLSGKAAGIDLCSAAWWTALVLGVGYLAYWYAITGPTQSEAQKQVETWIGGLNQGNVGAAFHVAIPPGGRQSIASGDLATMQARYRQEYQQFMQSRMVRTALRNKDQCQYKPGSLHDLTFQTGSMTCTATGTLLTPEGQLTLSVPLKSIDLLTGDREKVSGGRQWQVLPSQDGYVTASEQTPYGWAVAELLAKGMERGFSFLALQRYGPGERREAFHQYVEGGNVATDPDLSPVAALGGWGVMANFPPAWLDRTSDRLFTREGGAAPTEEDRARFRRMWKTIGVMPVGTPGSRLKDHREVETFILTPDRLELQIPVEIPIPNEKGEAGAALGRLVLATTDAPLLARLNELRKQADPSRVTPLPPADLNLPAPNWRVLRIESNLHFIPLSQGQGQGSKGG